MTIEVTTTESDADLFDVDAVQAEEAKITVPVETVAEPEADEAAAPAEPVKASDTIMVTALSSDLIRSTRSAPGWVKKAVRNGDTPKVYAVETRRDRVPQWRVRTYHPTLAEAKATAKEVKGRTEKGGTHTATQVVEAEVVVVSH